jgi:hypothetical protein
MSGDNSSKVTIPGLASVLVFPVFGQFITGTVLVVLMTFPLLSFGALILSGVLFALLQVGVDVVVPVVVVLVGVVVGHCTLYPLSLARAI